MMFIFDFDLTLVNTRSLQSFRERREWKTVMARLDKCPFYPGIAGLLRELDQRQHPMAILTHSPSMVPKKYVKDQKWPIPIHSIIGYHDLGRRGKPSPYGLQLAMGKANVRPEQSCHVGDKPIDIQASKAAGVLSIGACWGITEDEVRELEREDADYLLQKPEEIIGLLDRGELTISKTL